MSGPLRVAVVGAGAIAQVAHLPALRRLCRTEFLNYLRVREWQDIFSQLRQVTRTLGITPGSTPNTPAWSGVREEARCNSPSSSGAT